MRTQHPASATPAGTARAATTRRGLARMAWHKVSAVVSEMNYAACRIAEPRVTGRPAGPGA